VTGPPLSSGAVPQAEVAGPQPGARRALIALCVSEITSWGALYYAFPVVLADLTRTSGWSPQQTTAAFSTGLVISALAGVPVGRLLDRHGPRLVMTTGSMVGAGALVAVAMAPTLPWFFAAWTAVGLAQSMLLYTPAFSALTRWYGPRRVTALTTLSLVAGLSSTVFAPVVAVLVARLGWRDTYLVLAVLLGAITIPPHGLLLTAAWPGGRRRQRSDAPPGYVRSVVGDPRFILLVAAMVLAAFGMYAANINLVPLLTGQGISNELAAVALGLAGMGQVLGRLVYPVLTRRTSPRTRAVGVMVAGAGTVALLAAILRFASAVLAAAILAGAVRGIYTLLQATALSDRWGTRHFPVLNGIFSAPTTISIALAPAGGALLASWLGSYRAAFGVLAVLVLVGAASAVGTEVPKGRASASG
jgi:MFS family permease